MCVSVMGRVFQAKTWNEIKSFKEHKTAVTGVRFGADAKFIATVGMDRHLTILSSSA